TPAITALPLHDALPICSAAPAPGGGGDTNSVEVGVKFRADTSGSVTGIRFYKLSVNTGPHIGSLWTSTGTLLASATFTGETASRSQEHTSELQSLANAI